MPRARINHILLTGAPGCGKTTVICRLAERLGDLRLAGFYRTGLNRLCRKNWPARVRWTST
jgi:nucleoside-triphosphatase THEP1